MDSSFFLTTVAAAIVAAAIVAAAIGFFTFWRKVRVHQDNKEKTLSSSTHPLPPSSLSPSPVPPSSLSCIWTHQVFPSFRGEDVRTNFLSHIQMEFQRMGITPFIDNEIRRGESIGPELIRAIKGSKIAIILLSRNYASSKWCLDELVEIMKCRKERGQTVMVIFYKVDPSDVKKLTGDFGKVFRKTCAGKTKQYIGRWREALAEVATIAGYHSSNWDNEAAMIKKIATDISNILINSTPSRDFDRLVGMKAHLEKMEPLLCLESYEVRMVGIWGPPGIGKTTIARVAFHRYSSSFDLRVFMENIKENYTRPCSDDYSTKLQLQQQFLSKITNHTDMQIPHLGVAEDRLKDKKVLVVLDGVDQSVQLDAMAKESSWFGPGSRIIITTQDHRLFRAHGINHIYKVDFPSADEALQIFCMNAFDQKSPKDGFEELARKVTGLVGDLPLGLRVMGSYFRGRSKQEWIESLPRLYTSLPGGIQSILKFSYDALDDDDKDLFLYIACFFYYLREIKRMEEILEKRFLGLRQRLNDLAEKSLISIEYGCIKMHSLLEKLGRDIVRKQSINECGQRQLLVDEREIYEVLTSDAAGSNNVIGINFCSYNIREEVDISEKAFEGMSNLQLLRVYSYYGTLRLPRGLSFLSRKLRLLDWSYFPMTCLPSIVNVEFLVELSMRNSKLEKLWEGIKPLRNLRRMDFRYSVNLKELPDLSTATNLQVLDLYDCSSLIKLPCSIGYTNNLRMLDLRNCSVLTKLPSCFGNATNLEDLYLGGCSSLVEFPSFIWNSVKFQRLDLSSFSNMLELPSSIGNAINHNLQSLNLNNCSSLIKLPSCIGNATNLTHLDLTNCSNLVELPLFIGNFQNLSSLKLRGCSKLHVLPTNINFVSLRELDLNGCSMLKTFPEISTNIKTLDLRGTTIEEVPPSIKSWSCFDDLKMSYWENLKDFPHVLDSITWLDASDTEIQEIPPWVKRMSRLRVLELMGCRKLVSLSQIPDSLSFFYAEDCESLERLDCSFHNPDITLYFGKCFRLNQEARDLIIETPTEQAVLPGREVPAYFTHRASGGSLTIKLNESPLPTSMRFKACILLVYNGDDEAGDSEKHEDIGITVTWRQGRHFLYPYHTEHLHVFEVNTEVTSNKLVFDFKVETRNDWKIAEFGLRQLLAVPSS